MPRARAKAIVICFLVPEGMNLECTYYILIFLLLARSLLAAAAPPTTTTWPTLRAMTSSPWPPNYSATSSTAPTKPRPGTSSPPLQRALRGRTIQSEHVIFFRHFSRHGPLCQKSYCFSGHKNTTIRNILETIYQDIC